jgi:hypothetical protein
MAASNAPAQKFRSNWFRVAVEGATSDGARSSALG